MTEDQKVQLSNEQLLGGKAKNSYDDFIQDFCEQKRLAVFQAFRDLPLTDTENLMEIKRMLFAVDALESDILTVIETGKMASITLNEQEVKH